MLRWWNGACWVRQTYVRFRSRGLSGLREEFAKLNKFVEEIGSSEEKQIFYEEVHNGLKSIEFSWERVNSGERATQFQICTRQHDVRQKNKVVDMFLKSIEEKKKERYMLPVNIFFEDLYESLIMDLFMQSPATFSPCGLHIAVMGRNCRYIVAEI